MRPLWQSLAAVSVPTALLLVFFFMRSRGPGYPRPLFSQLLDATTVYVPPHDKSHVLVTGGAGYIGSHAVLLLLEQGHMVTVVDNLSRGNMGAIEALAKVALPGQLVFHEVDLGNADHVKHVFRGAGVDVVMHFAAVAYVGESQRDPLMYHRNITTNTLHIVEAMHEAGVSKLIYSSTCATYGNAEHMPITEETPQVPVSPYGQAKLAAERIILDYQAAHSERFSVAVLRYFNVIGSDPLGRVGEAPRAAVAHKYGRISGACFDVATGSRPHLALMGTTHPTPDGTAVRDYIHVTDLVAAHVLVMQALKPGDLRVYNVAIGRGSSVREFVTACRRVTGHAIPVVEQEARPGDAALVYADPAKIVRELNWKPRFTDLTQSLQTAWEWHHSHPQGYK
eukprot:m.26976 g.26976  ORF g.26976 m.26976 type:complete len:395 (-) comp8399_c0_seq1:31-1215(-)